MKKITCLVNALLLFAAWCFSEDFEFINQDYKEIFYAVSLYKGISVTADDTVEGKGDFRVSGDDFDRSFESFLRMSRLYVEKNPDGWIVSRCRIQKNEDGLYNLDGFDLPVNLLYEKFALASGVCITFDSLPQTKVSIHTGFCEAEEVINRITNLCSGYQVEKKSTGFVHVGRITRTQSALVSATKIDLWEAENGLWNCRIENGTLAAVFEKLCSQAGKDYSILWGTEARLLNLSINGKSFEELMTIICEQGGGESVFADNVYYLLQSKNNRKKIEARSKKWWSSSLCFASRDDFLSVCSKRFPEVEIIFTGRERFIFLCTEKEKQLFDEFRKSFDVMEENHLVLLKYLKAEDVIKNPPPFLNKHDLFSSGRSDSFYYRCSSEKFKEVNKNMQEFDIPPLLITYDLLIIQYQKSNQKEWNPTLGFLQRTDAPYDNFTIMAGSVLDFNIDLVNCFGIKFTADLQASINESRASVFADTTLTGISGKPISFQNTSTYRYRDNNLDPETGKPVYSGVTREIVSGLKLEITGTVNGEGNVNTAINASISRRGEDSSFRTGNPPPSSEKLVSTEVCGKWGEPVVLSGLVQKDESYSTSRIPYISRIPLLGMFFKGKNVQKETTEMVIYLVPRPAAAVSESEAETDEKEEYRRLAKEFEIL